MTADVQIEQSDALPGGTGIQSNEKHPLQNKWTLRFDRPSGRTNEKNWADSLKEIITFATVEDFWGTFNNILAPSKLISGANYHLFKEGIFPAWEDKQNLDGGKWTVTFRAGHKEELDNAWLYTVMGCIGETFEYGDDITGIVVSTRKSGDRISLWTKTAGDKDMVLSIGRQFKQFAGIPDEVKISYTEHKSSEQRKSPPMCEI